jgi:hypothetical protein
MKKLTVVFLIVGFISLNILGCTATQQQYAIQSSLIGIETQVLKAQYGQVEQLLRDHQSSSYIFSEEEWRNLLNADAIIDILITKYTSLKETPEAMLNVQDIKFMWQLTAVGYKQARGVVENHFSEFNPSTQMLLNSFDQQAAITDARITELLSNPNNANINQSITLIATALGLAIKIVSISAALL